MGRTDCTPGLAKVQVVILFVCICKRFHKKLGFVKQWAFTPSQMKEGVACLTRFQKSRLTSPLVGPRKRSIPCEAIFLGQPLQMDSGYENPFA